MVKTGMVPEAVRHIAQPMDELMTKREVAAYLKCSVRQVEILAHKNRICQPIYLGESSPRWHRDALLASLAAGQQPANVEG